MVLVDARPEELALRPATSEFELTIGAFMARFGFFRLFGKVVMTPEILETLPQNYPWPFMFYPSTMETMRDEDPLESDKQALASGNLGDLPLIVIVHGNPSMFAALPSKEALQAEADWQDAQKKLAGLSSNGQLIVADGSGHAIPFERPNVVINAIQQLLAEQ